MKKIVLIFCSIFLFVACEDDTVNEAIETDSVIVESELQDNEAPADLNEEFDTVLNESYNDPDPEDEVAVETYQITEAVFKGAGQVEGDVSLHFTNLDSGEDLDFYHFDIDPEKEGLFTYKEIEGSAFSELVTNPEIKNVTLKLYWQIETRHIDLADEDAEVKVLKRIEK